MSFKILVKISHFTTMMFGIALGIALCIFYQHTFAIFLTDLMPIIIYVLIISIFLRIYTIWIWRKYNYSFKKIEKSLINNEG